MRHLAATACSSQHRSLARSFVIWIVLGAALVLRIGAHSLGRPLTTTMLAVPLAVPGFLVASAPDPLEWLTTGQLLRNPLVTVPRFSVSALTARPHR